MGIYLFDVYRSPNIGVFVRANEKFILAPNGLAPTKLRKLTDFLQVDSVTISVAGSRLLGPLMALNSKGILVSRLAEEDETKRLERAVGIPVRVLSSRYTSVGNLIAANDKGALVSPVLSRQAISEVRDILDVPTEVCSIASHIQVGAMVVVTGSGAIVNPRASEAEIRMVGETLKVPAEPGTVNGGVPIVASGIVANSKGAVVGSVTRGPELAIISRALKL